MGLHWPWGLNNRLKKFGAEGKEKPLQLNYQEPHKITQLYITTSEEEWSEWEGVGILYVNS